MDPPPEQLTELLATWERRESIDESALPDALLREMAKKAAGPDEFPDFCEPPSVVVEPPAVEAAARAVAREAAAAAEQAEQAHKLADAEDARTRGNARFAAGDFDAAALEYTAALALDPGAHLALANRAACLLSLADQKEAGAAAATAARDAAATAGAEADDDDAPESLRLRAKRDAARCVVQARARIDTSVGGSCLVGVRSPNRDATRHLGYIYISIPPQVRPARAHYIASHCITSHYLALPCITLHYIALRYIALRYIALRYIA